MMWHGAQLSKAYYGIEWYGMEGKNRHGMEKIFHIPYLHILTWCCWSRVFLSVKQSCRVWVRLEE